MAGLGATTVSIVHGDVGEKGQPVSGRQNAICYRAKFFNIKTHFNSFLMDKFFSTKTV